MDQAHCMVCTAWEKLREGLDLTNMLDMVKFFQSLLVEMEKKDDERTKGQEDSDGTTPGM